MQRLVVLKRSNAVVVPHAHHLNAWDSKIYATAIYEAFLEWTIASSDWEPGMVLKLLHSVL